MYDNVSIHLRPGVLHSLADKQTEQVAVGPVACLPPLHTVTPVLHHLNQLLRLTWLVADKLLLQPRCRQTVPDQQQKDFDMDSSTCVFFLLK